MKRFALVVWQLGHRKKIFVESPKEGVKEAIALDRYGDCAVEKLVVTIDPADVIDDNMDRVILDKNGLKRFGIVFEDAHRRGLGCFVSDDTQLDAAKKWRQFCEDFKPEKVL
jgi:hypothetical protein